MISDDDLIMYMCKICLNLFYYWIIFLIFSEGSKYLLNIPDFVLNYVILTNCKILFLTSSIFRIQFSAFRIFWNNFQFSPNIYLKKWKIIRNCSSNLKNNFSYSWKLSEVLRSFFPNQSVIKYYNICVYQNIIKWKYLFGNFDSLNWLGRFIQPTKWATTIAPLLLHTSANSLSGRVNIFQ